MKVTTSNGTILDNEQEPAGLLNRYIKSTELVGGYMVFTATTPDGYRTLLLLKGNEAVYESPQSDAMASHIDMIRLAGKE